ncbi:MAG: hypothetical protein ACTS1X_10075 [Parasphingopyxis sp.]|uniref:hypothetical protein n=1 Tax=Parasphingopyxis sp. TaxID=1920299 RepID=UPI003FA05717
MKTAAIPGTVAILSAALASAPASATDDAAPVEYRGQCEYADRFAPLLERGDHAFALCDSVVIRRENGRETFEFRRDGRRSMVRYAGTRSGDAMAVSQVQVRTTDPRPATGTCRLSYRDGTVSAVTCVANARGLTHAANLVPSRR